MAQLYIYIVEDDLLIASALKRILTSLGHSVCGITDNYNKAVFDLHRIEVDLVITDIMLNGEQNGIDLGKHISRYLNIPFIYHSSIVESKLIKEAWDSLPDAYLSKPVTKASLGNAIINSINRNHLAEDKKLRTFIGNIN